MNTRTKAKSIRTRAAAAVLTLASVSSLLVFPGAAPGALGNFADSIAITADAASNADSSTVISSGRMTMGIRYFSPNNKYYVVMQIDGNLVARAVVKNNPDWRNHGDTTIWSSGTNGNDGAFAQIQDDGNFVIYNKNKKPIWASNTDGRGKGCKVKISNSGDVFVEDAKGQKVWTSRSELNTNGGTNGRISSLNVGDCICSPNRQYRAVVQGDGNFVVYKYGEGFVWASNSSGRVKPTKLSIQTDGNLVLYGTTNEKWYTGVTPYSNGAHRLVLDNDGHLSVINNAGTKIWSSEERPFIWPVPGSNKVNSCFKEASGHLTTFHGAIDINGNIGDKVVAAREGKVIKVAYQYNGAGNYIVLEHNIGEKVYWTTYMHLSSTCVCEGDTVKTDQKIGEVGNTGASTGAHLDFSIRAGGTDWYYDSVRLDPLAYTKITSTLINNGDPNACSLCQPYINAANRYRNVLYNLTERHEFP